MTINQILYKETRGQISTEKALDLLIAKGIETREAWYILENPLDDYEEE